MPPKNRRDFHQTQALIAEAVKLLRSDKPEAVSPTRREELADAVDYSRTPEYIASGRYELVEKASSGDKNVGISCTFAYREHMKAATAAASTSLTDAVQRALTELADGKFTPTRPTRAKHGTAKGQRMTNINTRQNPDLVARAEARCAELAEELGWTPKLSSTVKQWLDAWYGRPEQPAGE